jgi:hypothetical protein
MSQLKYFHKKSRGLGDTIEKVTRVTGIYHVAKAVEKVTGKPCGCEGRKENLNEKYPYDERNN